MVKAALCLGQSIALSTHTFEFILFKNQVQMLVSCKDIKVRNYDCLQPPFVVIAATPHIFLCFS